MQCTGNTPPISFAMLRKMILLTGGSVVLSLMITATIILLLGETGALPLGLAIAGFCPVLVTPPATYVFCRQTMELQAAYKALGEAHRNLSDIHARLKTAHEDLEHRASHDAMTGLANRDRFLSHLSELKRQSHSGYLLMIDADHFKQINDLHGHDAGDRALLAVGQAIAGSIRPTDLGARIGGEEFAIILRGSSEEGAAMIAERVRANVENISLCTADGTPLHVTVSIGGAAFGPQSRSKEVMRQADSQLYEAKRSGRNRVVMATGKVTRAA
ncbi:GGDEF domain-containing protein [Hoeflea sp.]|uniref:GGDEF domain-containing protein n=1 Tax=Hoeflea sp. TaxID=1940281 RepID=UPI003A90C84B